MKFVGESSGTTQAAKVVVTKRGHCIFFFLAIKDLTSYLIDQARFSISDLMGRNLVRYETEILA